MPLFRSPSHFQFADRPNGNESMFTATAQEDSINSVITPNPYVCHRPFNHHHYCWRTIDALEVCFRLRLGFIFEFPEWTCFWTRLFSLFDMSIAYDRIKCCFLLNSESGGRGLFAIYITSVLHLSRTGGVNNTHIYSYVRQYLTKTRKIHIIQVQLI